MLYQKKNVLKILRYTALGRVSLYLNSVFIFVALPYSFKLFTSFAVSRSIFMIYFKPAILNCYYCVKHNIQFLALLILRNIIFL